MSRFWKSKDGNVGVAFALAAIPVIGLISSAVDYSRASDARGKLQVAIDSTALLLSREPPTATQQQLMDKGYTHFSAVYQSLIEGNVPAVPAKGCGGGFCVTANPDGPGTLKVDASTTMPASVLNITDSIAIGATATVKWGKAKLEVMMALDNTGSMASNNKMTKLREAATNLVNTLSAAAAKPGDVKVGLVPFDVTVKIGTGYKDATWLKWGVSNVRNERVDEADDWRGCVMDRDKSYDTTDTAPTSTATKFPAAVCRTGSLAQMMPLTTDWQALKDRIAAMQPAGNTNVTIGLEWAWHNLTLNEPITAVGTSTAEEPLDKVIILLTDGDNTENRWSTSQSSIDARTSLACTNAKANGIIIYTVRVMDGNRTLLKACASDTSKYYEVTDAAQLVSVFNTIAGNLSKLHISK